VVVLVRRLVALALALPFVAVLASTSQAEPRDKPLNACEGTCLKTERACRKKCLDDDAVCRQPCGCADAPHTCTPAQRQCHAACANRMFGCEKVCQKDFAQCRKKC
jgi:hypothetical protein